MGYLKTPCSPETTSVPALPSASQLSMFESVGREKVFLPVEFMHCLGSGHQYTMAGKRFFSLGTYDYTPEGWIYAFDFLPHFT